MAFYIDAPEVGALATELARIRGITPEEAIKVSVIHALEKLKASEKDESAASPQS